MNRKERRADRARRAKLETAKLRAMSISDKGIPYTIRTLDGQPFWDAAAIFLIFTSAEGGKSQLVGTAFYTTRFGHFLTAKHVLMELHTKQKNGFMIHMLDDDASAIVRKITQSSPHPSADIALGALDHPPGYILNAVPRLTTECPKVGEQIVTVAFERKTGTFTPKGELLIAPTYFSGEFEEPHPQGRDPIMLPFPCYRTSISIPAGASGGPVFDSKGRVFGINCTGFDGTEVSYLARVEEALTLTAAGMRFGPDDVPTDRTLLEFVQTRHVVFVPEISTR